ncbi:MAG TPA: ATP-binding protein [Firmicutes bacterium]|nr:ATP-binding protein [Bacillota bacterium]
MKSAHALATQELAEIRETNKRKHAERLRHVRNAAPEFIQIENSMQRAGTQLLKSVLHGNTDDFEKIKSIIQKKQAEKAELLRNLDLPEDYLDEKYDCDICGDTGFDDNGRRCECLKKLINKYIIQNSNMSEIMKSQRFDTLDFTLYSETNKLPNGRTEREQINRIYNAALKFANTFDEDNRNLLLIGNAGTGKTFLSSCIANRALERGKTVYYQTAYPLFELMENIKFGKNNDDPEAAADMAYTAKYLRQVDLLIIDDLGSEFTTQFTAAAFFDLLNARLTSGKSVILSTNLSLDDLETLYSRRVSSRLQGEFQIIRTIGDDIREKKLKHQIYK